MYKKKYQIFAILNLILGACAICLYVPYTIQVFNIKGFNWLNFAKDLLKTNYYDVLLYFGIFLLMWFIILNLFSILSNFNVAKLAFKMAVISALILPLIYVLGLKYDEVLELWIKYIAPNIKMISYLFLCISIGSFALGLLFNFTKENRANIHHIVQALVMCILLSLLIAINGWCGWSVNTIKLFGILMSLFALYLPFATLLLTICAKMRI